MSYDLSFLSGNLTYFYTYPTIRFCKVLGLSIIPCGFKLARKEKSFQSWPGSHLGPFDVFNKNDPAFELSLACWPLGCGPDPDPDPGPICGNNDCDGTEDCNSCEADCGVCDYSVQEFPVPGPPRFPLDITKGPDGNLWFTYYHGSDIGRITPWGDTTQFRSPCPSPGGITTGPDGNLWYTCAGGIGRMTPTGATTTFTLPSSPGPVFGTPGHSIAVGADGNLWFPINYQAGEPNSVLRIGGKIGRITPDGVITEFPLPFAFSSESILQSGITPGPDGNLWYTRYGSSANRIGRVDLTGRVTEFRIPNGTDAAGITTGPDGNLWFVGGSVNRATPSGVITQFPLSTPSSFAYGITSGPDGNLWFTENRTNRIGRITPAGVMREISVPTPGANPNGITVGPDGAIWFIESNANKIGRLSW